MIYTGLSKKSLGRTDTGIVPAIVAVAAPSVDPGTLSPIAWWSLRDGTKTFKDNGVTLAANGDPIQRLNNKGSDPFWLVGSGAARPTLTTLNGKPVADFNGTASEMATNDWFANTLTQPFTLVVGAKFRGDASAFQRLLGGSSFQISIFGAAGGGTYRMYAGVADLTVGSRDTSPHCFIVEYNGSSSSLQIDSAAPITGLNPGTSGLQGALFVGSSSGSQFWDGQFSDFILISGLIPDASKPGLVNYIRAGLGL